MFKALDININFGDTDEVPSFAILMILTRRDGV
nr:MAG TPA: hypothetical protein [Caudoviricetes sp.]